MVESAQVVSFRSRLEAVTGPGVALTALVPLNLIWGGSLPATRLAPAAIRKVPIGDGLRMAGLGVIGFGGVQVLQALGTAQTRGATASVFAPTAPLWIAVLAPAVLRERLHSTEVLMITVWPTLLGWWLLAYLGVLVTFFGFAVWFWGVLGGVDLGVRRTT